MLRVWVALGACLAGSAGPARLSERAASLVDTRPAAAAAAYAQACDRGLPAACVELGRSYAEGRGVDRDDARAASLFGPACAAGHPYACAALAVLVAEGRAPGTPADAAQLFEQACEAGDPFGCNGLGVLAQDGTGMPTDTVRAAWLFHRACAGGKDYGCRNLASVVSRAQAWYELACNGGDERACALRGLALRSGLGVAPDPFAARDLLGAACAANLGPACTWLGQLYEIGQLGVIDADSARAAYQTACELDEAPACELLVSP